MMSEIRGGRKEGWGWGEPTVNKGEGGWEGSQSW